MTFTDAETAYLASQRLGRLATIGPDGSPQVKPVGFRYNPGLGTIDVTGFNMAASHKFRNVGGVCRGEAGGPHGYLRRAGPEPGTAVASSSAVTAGRLARRPPHFTQRRWPGSQAAAVVPGRLGPVRLACDWSA